MTGNHLALAINQRLLCSWRYVTPSRAKSQDYYEAFVLRSNELAVSFDVNSNALMSSDQKRSEIYDIYDKKPNYKTSGNGRFLMIDLINAQDEANFSGEKINAIIDGVSHCSLYYTNNSYKDDASRLEVMGILYHNIKDIISISKNSDKQMVISVEKFE